MTATIIDGKAFALKLRERVATEAADFQIITGFRSLRPLQRQGHARGGDAKR
jgi:hypothetical protein